MNKAVPITLALACFGGGYTAASWYFGKQTEATLSAQYEHMLDKAYNINLVDRDYQRGIFHSTETLTLEIIKDPAISAAIDGEEYVAAKQQLFKLTVHNDIQHGPIPGFSTFAAASTDTDVMLIEGVEKELAEQLANKTLFNQHMIFHFDGTGHATFNMPKLDLTLPAFIDSTTEKTAALSWDGMKGDMTFSADMAHFTLNARSPIMTLTSSIGEKVNLSNIQISSEQQKAYEDIDALYSGIQHLSIDGITLTTPKAEGTPFSAKQLTYDVNFAKDGDFLNLVEQIGIETAQIGQDKIGPFHFDFSLNHLHGHTLADIAKSLNAYNVKMSKSDKDQEAATEQLGQTVKKQGQHLLDNHPEFRIDRISLATADGDTNLSGQVTLNKLNIEEAIENPFIMLGSLNATGKLSFNEKMILELLRNPPGSELMGLNDEASDEQMTRINMITEQFQQQLAMFTGMGYLTRDGDSLKTHAEFKTGKLLINGKPFPPVAAPTPIEQDSTYIESDPSPMEQESTTDKTDPTPMEEAPLSVEAKTTPN
jgi:uncharacterized protein YdgA (DUF945 family)